MIGEYLLSDDAVDLSELCSDEVQLTQACVNGQALIDRQLLGVDPGAALLAERVAGRAAALEVAMQDRRDLVLDLRAALDQPPPARHQPAQHPAALVTDPHRRNQIG